MILLIEGVYLIVLKRKVTKGGYHTSVQEIVHIQHDEQVLARPVWRVQGRGANALLIPSLKSYLMLPNGTLVLGRSMIAFEQVYRGWIPRLMVMSW
jgi:hypothetical protein